jgi:hypothetical protein
MDAGEKIKVDRMRCLDQAKWCQRNVTRDLASGNLLSVVNNYIQMVRFNSEARGLKRAMEYMTGEDEGERHRPGGWGKTGPTDPAP